MADIDPDVTYCILALLTAKPNYHFGVRVRYSFGVSNSAPNLKVLVYSDDSAVRTSIKVSLGRRPSVDFGEVEILECATHPAVIAAVDSRPFDLLILDGEATPSGGMGLCRQLKDEIFNCPPILVLVGRVDDRWLATWSRADAVVAHPIDPRAVVNACLDLLKSRNSISQ
jgi:DNA-binding response OmpR family regulator